MRSVLLSALLFGSAVQASGLQPAAQAPPAAKESPGGSFFARGWRLVGSHSGPGGYRNLLYYYPPTMSRQDGRVSVMTLNIDAGNVGGVRSKLASLSLDCTGPFFRLGSQANFGPGGRPVPAPTPPPGDQLIRPGTITATLRVALCNGREIGEPVTGDLQGQADDLFRRLGRRLAPSSPPRSR